MVRNTRPATVAGRMASSRIAVPNEGKEIPMPIASAVQRGSFVYVYDTKGSILFTRPCGNRPGDGLRGYTSSTVSIKTGHFISTFNDKGMQISTVPGD